MRAVGILLPREPSDVGREREEIGSALRNICSSPQSIEPTRPIEPTRLIEPTWDLRGWMTAARNLIWLHKQEISAVIGAITLR